MFNLLRLATIDALTFHTPQHIWVNNLATSWYFACNWTDNFSEVIASIMYRLRLLHLGQHRKTVKHVEVLHKADTSTFQTQIQSTMHKCLCLQKRHGSDSVGMFLGLGFKIRFSPFKVAKFNFRQIYLVKHRQLKRELSDVCYWDWFPEYTWLIII